MRTENELPGLPGGESKEETMDMTERIAAAAALALDAAEAELRAVLDAGSVGGRADLRQIKDALALLKELTSLTRELGGGASAGVTVRFDGEDVAAAGE